MFYCTCTGADGWMYVWVRVLSPFKQYFSHFETMEGWTWKALCNEAPFRFGKNLASSEIRTRDPITVRQRGRFYGYWWYSNLKQYVLESKVILRPSVVCQHFQTAFPLDSDQISHVAYTGRGNEQLCFFLLLQSDKNSGYYGNFQLPLICNGKSENRRLLLPYCRYFDKSF